MRRKGEGTRQAEEDGGGDPSGMQRVRQEQREDSTTGEFERPCLKNQTWRTSQACRENR